LTDTSPQTQGGAAPTRSDLPVVLVAGPTGVGKTAFAVELARKLGSEIVNADSMQVYRHMDIGTAKPTPEERSAVAHHLLDVVDPDEPFDAGDYLERARPVIRTLHEAGKVPLVVGGTGLYLKVLTRGICAGAPGDPQVRSRLIEEEQTLGLPALHERLLEVDPALGARLHPNDRQRILRALEVFHHSGKPLSHWQQQHRFEDAPYRTVKIFLNREREELYARIDARVETMMAQGFLDEVRKLLALGYGPELKPMQSLGYRQLARHLRGELSLDEALAEIRRDTRRYAKRQLTWFRADPEFRWFAAGDREELAARIAREVIEAMP
jgi:tRNA dimethylallyltransferase